MDTKKQKVIKVLKRIGIALSIGFNVLFLIAIIVGSSGIKNKSNNVQVACAESEVIKVDSQVNKKFVSYNDSSYQITLTSEELNNGTFENLFNYINNDISVSDNSSLDLGTSVYGSLTGVSKLQNYGGKSYYLFSGSSYSISLNNTSHKFICRLLSDHSVVDIDNGVVLTLSSDYYEGFKSAIELDIPSDESNINDGIFETLTSGVVAFIGSIGSGITAMTSVFYDSTNSQLTTIGLLSVIVVAISLAYFLFRLIIGLIRMRG